VPTVDDAAVVEALRFAFERLKVVLEPSGACAPATLRVDRERFRGQRVGVTLSGGNVGIDRFVEPMSGMPRTEARNFSRRSPRAR
jgi:threonine dehydratase